MKTFLPTIRKALTAGVLAAVGAVGLALSDGALTTAELAAAIGVGLVAAGGTYRIPNAPNSPNAEDDVQR